MLAESMNGKKGVMLCAFAFRGLIGGSANEGVVSGVCHSYYLGTGRATTINSYCFKVLIFDVLLVGGGRVMIDNNIL